MAAPNTPNEEPTNQESAIATPPPSGTLPDFGAPAPKASGGLFSSTRAKVILVIIALIILTAAGSIAVALINQANMTVTGTWNFTATSSVSGAKQNGAIDLKQQGSSVIGTFTQGSRVFTINGTISGQTITMNFTGSITIGGNQAQVTLAITGTVDSAYASMSGTYTAMVAGITDRGVWNATKTSPT